MSLYYGGPGVTPSIPGLTSNEVTLAAGNVFLLPSGWWEVKPGKYTTIQEYDPITGTWLSIGGGDLSGALQRVKSDGNNVRLANQTGCPVGAVVTTAGSGYTSAPTVTASTGSSIWQAIVGGYVSAVTVTNGGTGYTYPPIVQFSLPPNPGVPATGYATISGGVITAVTISNAGAGYTAAPTVTFINDPREGANSTTIGSGATATSTIAGSGTVTAVVCLDHGTAGTSIPTLSFSGGGGSSAAATAVMCWTITAYTVSSTTAGSGYVSPVIVSAYQTALSGSAITNPFIQSGLVKGRNAFIIGALSSGAITATGQTVNDGGIYDQTPTVYVASQGVFGAAAVQATFTTPTMGGVTDTSLLLPSA